MWEHSKDRPYLQLIGDQAAEEKLRLENPEAYRNLVDFKLNFGSLDRFRGSDNDLLSLLERRVKSGCELPKLDISIGIQDYLYPTNVTFRHKLDELHVPYRYHEEPGVHEWAVWDRAVTRVLDWLPVEREIPTGNGGDREARRQREEEK